MAIRNWAKITFQNYSEEQESFFYNFKKLFLPNSLIRRKNRNLNQDLSDQREKPKTQVCIVLNFILIPLFSKEGAAIATLLSYIGLIYMSFKINNRLLPVHYEKTRLLKIVLGLALAAGLSFSPIKNNLIYNSLMISTIIGYIFYLYIFCINKSEKNIIKNYITKKTRVQVQEV